MKRFLHHPVVRTHAPQFMKFVLSGGIGSIVDLCTLALLTKVLHVRPEIGFLLSSFVGATCVFFINKLFTFKNFERAIVKQLLKFYSVYGPAIIANFFLSSFLYWVGFPVLIAKPVAIAIIAAWNYTMSHYYVFKKKNVE